MQEKESCFHAFLLPYLFIFIIGIVVYYGVVDTNGFLVVTIILTIVAIFGVIVLVFLGCHFYPTQNNLNNRFVKSIIHSNENEISDLNEQISSDENLIALLRLPKATKSIKTNREIRDELIKVEHFYISIY